ncbi:MAG: Hpt domain-containing protein [Chitinophagaceae bacterium]|nr:Hpt domain-containing protein [Chitinophagaceae bacterium]
MNNTISLDYLSASVSGHKEILLELFDIFIKQIPENIASLNDAIINADYPAIKQISHKLKSTVSVMGISTLKPILDQMEFLATADHENLRLDSIKKLFEQVKEICTKAIEEIQFEKNRM